MIRSILQIFGFQITYVCEWGEYEYRYSGVDQMATRPIHRDMSVAPPWAKPRVRRISNVVG